MSEQRLQVVNGLTLDLARGCLMRKGEPVHLRPLSYEVLKHLLENKGRLVGKEELIERVWRGRAVTDGSIGKCIEEVRAALGDGRGSVRDVRGRGYIFDPQLPAGDEPFSPHVVQSGTVAGVPQPAVAAAGKPIVIAAAAVIVAVAVLACFAYFAAPSPGGAPVPTTAVAQNSLANQYFLNGLFYRRKGGADNVRKALEYFNRAVAVDAGFARGWAAVAQANLDFAGNSFEQPSDRIHAAKAAIERALALDRTLAEAHLTLALINQSEWNWAAAQSEYRKAVALSPNLAQAHAAYGRYLKHIGHHVEALTEIRRAEALDPLSVGLKANEASVLSFMQRGDQAIQMTRQAIAAEPDAGTHHDTLGFIYCSSGMYDEAAAEFREGMRFDGEITSRLCYLGFALAKSGRRSQAEAILSRLKTTTEYVSPVELGALYVGLGQYDIALELLEEGYKTHDLQMQFLKTDLTYDAIRSDPRFVEMIRRVGLPD